MEKAAKRKAVLCNERSQLGKSWTGVHLLCGTQETSRRLVVPYSSKNQVAEWKNLLILTALGKVTDVYFLFNQIILLLGKQNVMEGI